MVVVVVVAAALDDEGGIIPGVEGGAPGIPGMGDMAVEDDDDG